MRLKVKNANGHHEYISFFKYIQFLREKFSQLKISKISFFAFATVKSLLKCLCADDIYREQGHAPVFPEKCFSPVCEQYPACKVC